MMRRMNKTLHAGTPSDAAKMAIAALGGLVAAARRLNVPGHRYQTVQGWLKSRVPAEYCPAIERETRLIGAEMRCELLRPDVDWGVLRHPQSSAPTLVPEVQNAQGEGA